MIIKKINEKYTTEEQEVIITDCFNVARSLDINPASILAIFPYGSFNYNLSDQKSDLDLLVIYVPTFHNLFENYIDEKNVIKEKIKMREFGEVIFVDIYKYLKQVNKGNLRYLETTFSSNILFEKKFFKKFLNQARYMFLLQNPDNIRNFMVGYISQKMFALSHPFPSKKELIEKYGYDLKNYSHVLRLENFTEKYLILLDYLQNFGLTSEFNKLKFNPFLIQNNRQETVNPKYLINLKRHNLDVFPDKDEVLTKMKKIKDEIKENKDFILNPFCIISSYRIKKLEEELLDKCFYFVKGI